jgi:hypothetical protein
MKGSGKISAAVGLALAGALVLAAHAPMSSAQVGATHLEVFNVEGRFEKDVDLGKAGFPTAGDYAVESQPLLDPADGSTVGRSLSELTIVRSVSQGQDFEVVLDSTLRLSDGDLVLDGGIRFSELFEGGAMAVVGGTGAYAGARGTAAFTPGTVDGKDGFLISIDVTLG